MAIKTIHVTATVSIPYIPNFFIQPGGGTIPIEAITDEGLRIIGNNFTEELIKKAQAKRFLKESGNAKEETQKDSTAENKESGPEEESS